MSMSGSSSETFPVVARGRLGGGGGGAALARVIDGCARLHGMRARRRCGCAQQPGLRCATRGCSRRGVLSRAVELEAGDGGGELVGLFAQALGGGGGLLDERSVLLRHL